MNRDNTQTKKQIRSAEPEYPPRATITIAIVAMSGAAAIGLLLAAVLKAEGVTVIINNRPDGEDPSAPQKDNASSVVQQMAREVAAKIA